MSSMEVFAPLRYLTRPLYLESALFIAIAGLLFALAARAGLFGLALGLAVIACFLKYAFLLLDHIADGKDGAPVLSAETANPASEPRPWVYLLLALIGWIATESLRPMIGAQGVFAARALCVVVLPAMIAAHSVTGSFSAAINPVAVTAMIWRMGWGYGCVLIVAALCVTAMQFVAMSPQSTDEPGVRAMTMQFVPDIVRLMMLMYLWLAMFAVLGGALFEYRNAIGYDAAESPERKQGRDDAELDKAHRKFLDSVFAEYRSGAYINAWNTIEAYARGSGDALHSYRWILAGISVWPNPRLANKLAQEMLPLLFAKRLLGEALDIAKHRVRADAEFRAATGEQTLKLAKLARDGGDRPLARALLTDFERHFPNDPVRTAAAQLAEQLAR